MPTENINYDITPGTLVNFNYLLFTTGDANGLVNIKANRISKTLNVQEDDIMLQAAVIEPLSYMARDCVLTGTVYFTVVTNGGYRDYATQKGFWDNAVEKNPELTADPFSQGGTRTIPGMSSEHRTGYAVDISTIAGGYTWLNENSWKYGFIHRYVGEKTEYTGIMDEYWHYTYVGRAIAETCYKENLCLEEYYLKYVFEDTDFHGPLLKPTGNTEADDEES